MNEKEMWNLYTKTMMFACGYPSVETPTIEKNDFERLDL